MILYSQGVKSQPLDIEKCTTLVDAARFSLVNTSGIDGRSLCCYLILDHELKSVVYSDSNKSEIKKYLKVFLNEQTKYVIERTGTWDEIETVYKYVSPIGSYDWKETSKIGALADNCGLVKDSELWSTPYDVFFNIPRHKFSIKQH